MADVIEVIYKINYEVNDADLNRVTDVIRLQITEITRLSNQLVGLQNALSNVSTANVAQLGKLSMEINKITTLLEKATVKTKGLFSGISSSFNSSEMAKIGDGLFDTVPKLVKDLSEVKVEGTGAMASLVGFVGKINPIVSVVSLLLPVIVDLGKALFGVGEIAEESGEKINASAEFSKKHGEAAASELASLLVLQDRIQNVNAKYEDRKNAVNELLEQYSGYFDKLSQEEILAGKVGNAYERVISAILNKAKIKVFEGQLEDSLAQFVELEDKIEGTISRTGIDVKKKVGIDGLTEYEIRNEEDNIVSNDIAKMRQANGGPLQNPLKVMQADLLLLLEQYNSVLQRIRNINGNIIETQKSINSLSNGGDTSRKLDVIERLTLLPYKNFQRKGP